MTRIVNIGEALIDEITRPNSEPVEVVGGSMLNVAAGLTRLGHESELATWFARDARGDKVRAHAEAAGVTTAAPDNGGDTAATTEAEGESTAHGLGARRAVTLGRAMGRSLLHRARRGGLGPR